MSYLLNSAYITTSTQERGGPEYQGVQDNQFGTLLCQADHEIASWYLLAKVHS
jgi:hypothetical protein